MKQNNGGKTYLGGGGLVSYTRILLIISRYILGEKNKNEIFLFLPDTHRYYYNHSYAVISYW